MKDKTKACFQFQSSQCLSILILDLPIIFSFHATAFYVNFILCCHHSTTATKQLRKRKKQLSYCMGLEKEMAAHPSILAWRIPWTEEPGRLQSMGSQEQDTTQRVYRHIVWELKSLKNQLNFLRFTTYHQRALSIF